MRKSTQLDIVREAANRPPYKQDVYVNAGQLLAEIEREYLPRPRYEDGEPVQEGDIVADRNGNRCGHKVLSWSVRSDGQTAFYTGTSSMAIKTGERVKRLQNVVLDAEGVPVCNGDIVWEVDEDGHVSTRAFRVVGLNNTKNTACICPAERGGAVSHIAADMLTHKQPDSLERIEADAKLDVCVYYAGRDEHKCDGCRGAYCFECKHEMTLDLLRRQREVLERGHER